MIIFCISNIVSFRGGDSVVSCSCEQRIFRVPDPFGTRKTAFYSSETENHRLLVAPPVEWDVKLYSFTHSLQVPPVSDRRSYVSFTGVRGVPVPPLFGFWVHIPPHYSGHAQAKNSLSSEAICGD